MTKWQYKEVSLPNVNVLGTWEKKLNELGQEGWELITAFPKTNLLAGSTGIRAIFKRPL